MTRRYFLKLVRSGHSDSTKAVVSIKKIGASTVRNPYKGGIVWKGESRRREEIRPGASTGVGLHGKRTPSGWVFPSLPQSSSQWRFHNETKVFLSACRQWYQKSPRRRQSSGEVGALVLLLRNSWRTSGRSLQLQTARGEQSKCCSWKTAKEINRSSLPGND